MAGDRQVDEIVDADVLVVGGGIAGCWAAIRASEFPVSVVLADKARVARSGQSTFAAGVMLAPQPGDDLAAWREEIVEAGDYLNEQEWVDLVLQEQVYRIEDMSRWGFPFERGPDGGLHRTIGRGHLSTRILMFHGKELMEKMRRQCLQRGVRLMERVMVTDLLTSDGRHPTRGSVIGALGLHTRTGRTDLFRSRSLVMSAGPVVPRTGGGYVDNISGDGLAASFRAGAQLTGMEFCTSSNITVWHRKYIASGINMMQGSGARIVNSRGERFMEKYNSVLPERSRTHLLGQAFTKEALGGRGPIYMDLRHLAPEVSQRFRRVIPKTMRIFDAAGIDPAKDMIECTPRVNCPASPSGNGGIRVNLQCETTLSGLLAAGSATKNLAHGTYAVGGLNLAYCCVSGYRAGVRAARLAQGAQAEPDQEQVLALLTRTLQPLGKEEGPRPDDVVERVKRMTIPAPFSFFKHERRIRQVLEQLRHLQEQEVPRLAASDVHELVKATEARSLVDCAILTYSAALERKESRENHFREEYPYRDDENWLVWLNLRRKEDALETWTEPVPFDRYPVKPPPPRRIPAPVQCFFEDKRGGDGKWLLKG